jgi:phage gpG-like protein
MEVQEFQERFERIVREFPGDTDEILRGCVPVVLEGIQDNFRNSKSAGGEPWPARKDPKLQHPLLILTGELESAATGKSGASVNRVRDGVLEIGVTKGASGTSLGGAAVHQFGDSSQNIAQREYLGFSENTMDACTETVADAAVEFIMEGLA